MSARSKARKHTLDILYEADIRKSDALTIIETRLNTGEEADLPPVRDYTKILVAGVLDHKRKIDELIATYIQGWDIDRLAAEVDSESLKGRVLQDLHATLVYRRGVDLVGASSRCSGGVEVLHQQQLLLLRRGGD